MSLTAKASGGGSVAPVEAGTHPAVCVSLIDIGEQFNEKYKKSSRKLIMQFEITDEQIIIDGHSENRIMSQTYTMSLNERSALYRDLIAWRSKPFTPEELAGFDLKKVLGVPCLLTITHTESDGGTYANISSISKTMKGMVVERTLPLVTFDLDVDPLERIEEFPEWIQKKIRSSETYKERVAGSADDDGAEYTGPVELTEESDDGQLPF